MRMPRDHDTGRGVKSLLPAIAGSDPALEIRSRRLKTPLRRRDFPQKSMLRPEGSDDGTPDDVKPSEAEAVRVTRSSVAPGACAAARGARDHFIYHPPQVSHGRKVVIGRLDSEV